MAGTQHSLSECPQLQDRSPQTDDDSSQPRQATRRATIELGSNLLVQQSSLSDGEVGGLEACYRRHSHCGEEQRLLGRSNRPQRHTYSVQPDAYAVQPHAYSLQPHSHRHQHHHHHIQPLSSCEGAPHIDMDEFKGHRRPKSKSIPYDTECLRRRHSIEGLRRASIPENDIITSFERVNVGRMPEAPHLSSSSSSSSSLEGSPPIRHKFVASSAQQQSQRQAAGGPSSSTGGSTACSSSVSGESSGEVEEDVPGSSHNVASMTNENPIRIPSEVEASGATATSTATKPKKRILRRKNTPANFPRIPKLDLSGLSSGALKEDTVEEEEENT